MTSVSWIAESVTFAGPAMITNTHAVGVAHAVVIAWTVRHHPSLADAWLLPVAAETWDGYLNDINGSHVTEQDCVAALEAAAGGPLDEGSVGGGTGMKCYEFKGGSGTASRAAYPAPVHRASPPGDAGPGPHRDHRLYFSGDLFLAFSTGNAGGFTPGVAAMTSRADGSYDRLEFIPWGYLNSFFEATVQATEEAVANAPGG